MASETVDNAPAVSDLPSDDAINPPPPPPPAAAADTAPDATVSRPTKLPLAALLAAAPSNIDAFIAHLSRCFQTPAGTDTVLLLICYTSRLSASVLEAVSATALRRSARRLVALAFSLPPDATIILSKAPPPSSAASLGLRVATRLRALSALLSEARTIMRLWALLPMYLWLRRLITTPSKKEGAEKEKQDSGAAAVDRAISWIQVTACLLLQSLESASYLASRGILPLTAAQTGAAARWSVRFWSVYVGSELGRLAVERLRRRRRVESGELDAASSEYREWEGTWSRTLARQASWFPLTVHWSMEKGFLPDAGVGLLGSIPGVVQMRQLWKDTA